MEFSVAPRQMVRKACEPDRVLRDRCEAPACVRLDAEPAHFREERSPRDAEPRRRSMPAADYPARLLEGLQNVGA